MLAIASSQNATPITLLATIISSDYVLNGFTSPDDFVIKETSMKYPDGGSYQVHW